MSKILRVVKHTAASFASLLVQLFQMVLLKLGYEFKGTFSVVFLGLHTNPECVCWGLFFFLTDFIFGTLVFFSIVFWLAYVFLPFLLLFNYHSCATVFMFSLCFGSIRIHIREICVTVKILMFVFTRKQ